MAARRAGPPPVRGAACACRRVRENPRRISSRGTGDVTEIRGYQGECEVTGPSSLHCRALQGYSDPGIAAPGRPWLCVAQVEPGIPPPSYAQLPPHSLPPRDLQRTACGQSNAALRHRPL
jgi:hypothetical protein